MTTKVEISHRTIFFTLLLLGGIWLFIQIKDILFLLFVSFVLMSALRPLVETLARFKIPRPIAILLIYVLIIGVLVVALGGLVPSLVIQTSHLAQDLPLLVSRLLPYWDINVQAITQQIAPISENVVRLTVGIFNNVLTILTILVFTFYFLLERKHTELFVVHIAGQDVAARVMTIVREVEKRLGAWVQGQLFLMTVIGICSYVGLSFLGVESALSLAIISGILEAVPIVGPIVSAIPAVFVAFSSSPMLALSVIVLYVVIQQLENNLIVPIVMKKNLGLSPLVTILALMIGGKLGGITGAVLAVPVVLVIEVIFSTLMLKPSQSPSGKQQ